VVRAEFSDERLHGADFTGRTLESFVSSGSTFEQCRFDRARLTSLSFGSGTLTSLYRSCTFDGAHFDMFAAGFARFEDCSFRDVRIRNWQCTAVELINCTFTGRLTRSYFHGTVPEQERQYTGRVHNEFHGNDFSGAELYDTDFRSGIDLTRQRLPGGPQYLYIADAPRVIAEVRRRVAVMEELEQRKELMPLLKVFEPIVAAGQQQLLINLTSWGRRQLPAVAQLREIVEAVG
jgi:hypothetical protein